MKTRSSDDIRYYFNNRLLPILLPEASEWTQEEDETLLKFIADQDLVGGSYNFILTQTTAEIPFEKIALDNKTTE